MLGKRSFCLTECLFTHLIQVIKRNQTSEATFFIFEYVRCSQREFTLPNPLMFQHRSFIFNKQAHKIVDRN